MIALRILLVTVLWCVLTRAATTTDVAVGATISLVLVLWGARLSGRASIRDRSTRKEAAEILRRVGPVVRLVARFVIDLLVANARLAVAVLHPRMKVRSEIVALPVNVGSEAELALLADLITLTPGTLTLDATDDGNTLLVHVADTRDPEAVREELLQGVVARVREVFE